TRVKAIAQEDEAIGKMRVEATSIIARCTEAFLADLVKASAERARAAGDRESERKRRKGPPSALLRQVLPEDVRKAAAEEERFDFLRPLLAPPDKQKHSASAPDRGKRKGGTTSGRRAGQARKKENPTNLGMSSTMGGMAAVSDLGAGAKVSGAGKGGDLLEFAGLDEEARMALLLGGPSTTQGVASGTGDEDEDEDYD
ncbi:unnamed protein product, partial [Laminaria digitata]